MTAHHLLQPGACDPQQAFGLQDRVDPGGQFERGGARAGTIGIGSRVRGEARPMQFVARRV